MLANYNPQPIVILYLSNCSGGFREGEGESSVRMEQNRKKVAVSPEKRSYQLEKF